MAAAVSAWGKPGAWALDSEEHEEELLKKEEKPITGNLKIPAPAPAALSDFPSLTVAATTKTKKKKGQTLSLAEFTSIGVAKPATATAIYQPKGLTQEDLIALPTGPRERTAEELERSRSSGFRSYNSSDRASRNSNDDQPRRQVGFDKDSTGNFASSRADEVDDWGAKKKSTIGGGGFDRRERGERGVGFFDLQSRADESDSWISKKSFIPSEGRRFNSGFERRGGFESNGGGGGADSDNWGKKKEFNSFDNIRERRGGYEAVSNGGADSDNWGKKREEGNGASGRPRLNLQPRKLPVGEMQESETVIVKPRGGLNPFGDAKPREEVLREKGQDWKELDEKLESMKKTMEGANGKRSFGSGNGRARLAEDRFEKSWRKPDSGDVRPQSAEKSENGVAKEAEEDSTSTTTQA